MKNKYFIYLILCLFTFAKVNAEACTLETQVTVNNDAGSVNASASSFEYNYIDTDTENGEEYEATAYTGLIHIYNLTPNVYAVASDGKKKITLHYDEENDKCDRVGYIAECLYGLVDCTAGNFYDCRNIVPNG